MRKLLKAAVMAGTVCTASVAACLVASPAFAINQGCAVQVNTNGGDGEVCVAYDPQGYRATYTTGKVAWGEMMDFNLECQNGRVFGDEGAFSARLARHDYTYVFAVGNQGWCRVALYNRGRDLKFTTPHINPDLGPGR